MFQETKEDVAYCYQRAEEARRMARRAGDRATRLKFEAMQDRWESLAQCHEVNEAAERYAERATGMIDRAEAR
jgi:hypothetical protein